jgi:SAM-dependent methyltransferase
MKKTIQYILEWIGLMALNLVVKKRNLFEYLKVIKRYYSNPMFRKTDCTLLSKYVFKSPYAMSKAFMEARGESDIYVYGETPLTSLELIAKECNLSDKDTVFDLGCGRGRGCFWLHAMIGCKVVGIEYIPEFMEKAIAVKQKYRLTRLEFRQQDFLKANLKGATVLYLYGTCLDPVSIRQLIDKILKLPQGTQIVTVSYSLKEFSADPRFEILKRFKIPFTWGEGDVYIQCLVDRRKKL